MPGDVVPVFDLGVVEGVGELEPAPSHLDVVSLRDEHVLLAGVVENAQGDVVDDVGQR